MASRYVHGTQPGEGHRRKPYRSFMEGFTEEKKPLILKDYHGIRPPPGYSYVPMADRYVVEYCKDKSRQRGCTAYAVTGNLPRNTHSQPISAQMHRNGYHFKADVVETAKKIYMGLTGDGSGGKNMQSVQKLQSQVETSIRLLFPKIPETDLRATVDRAFEEGTGRVGSATGLSLQRRLHLAVNAHIRHEHTHYDQHLKVMGWHDARAKIEPTIIQKLREWRGEEDPADGELEEIIREVIHIDSDDSDDDHPRFKREPSAQLMSHRQADPNIISARVRAQAHSERLAERNESTLYGSSAQLAHDLRGAQASGYQESLRRPLETSHLRQSAAPWSRPIYISSDRPAPHSVHPSIEIQQGTRKRRASPSLDAEPEWEYRQTQVPKRPKAEHHSPRGNECEPAPYTRAFRREGGEDIEVIDLRSPMPSRISKPSHYIESLDGTAEFDLPAPPHPHPVWHVQAPEPRPRSLLPYQAHPDDYVLVKRSKRY